MDQYRPAGVVDAEHFAEIDRPLRAEEFAEALATARSLGLRLDERRTASRFLERDDH